MLIQQLDTRSYSSGGQAAIQIEGLPPKERVRSIQLLVSLSGTKDNADTLDGRLFPKAIQNLKIDGFLNCRGIDLFKLQHAVQGRIYQDPTDLASGSTSWSASFVLDLDWRDGRQPAPEDGALPCEMLNGKSLELTWAASTVFGSNIVITSGTVRPCVERSYGTVVPQVSVTQYQDQASATAIITGQGVYRDLILVKSDASVITTSEVDMLDVSIDGVTILKNVRHEQLVAMWNRQCSRKGDELTPNAAAFLPIIWMDRYGKANLTKQPYAGRSLEVRITSGSLTNGRFVYNRVIMKDEKAVKEILAVTGAPANVTAYEPATASKSPIQAKPGSAEPSKKEVIATAALPGKVRA